VDYITTIPHQQERLPFSAMADASGLPAVAPELLEIICEYVSAKKSFEIASSFC